MLVCTSVVTLGRGFRRPVVSRSCSLFSISCASCVRRKRAVFMRRSSAVMFPANFVKESVGLSSCGTHRQAPFRLSRESRTTAISSAALRSVAENCSRHRLSVEEALCVCDAHDVYVKVFGDDRGHLDVAVQRVPLSHVIAQGLHVAEPTCYLLGICQSF